MRSARLAAAAAVLVGFAGVAGVTGSASGATHAEHGHIAAAKKLRPLTIGFSLGADPELASGNPVTQAEWVPKAQAEGAQMVRLDVYWNQIAPTAPSDPSDPDASGYNWTRVDEQVRELAAAGFEVLITLGDAPKWAEGAGMPSSATAGTWEPNLADYAAFAEAVATRYDGSFPDPINPGANLPRVKYWQAWDEPNLPEYLAPQWVKSGGKLKPYSPTLYRNMQNAFYKSVKGVLASNYVVMAGTGPYGDPPSLSPTARIHPVTFDEDAFCLNAALRKICSSPIYLDAIDNHPYGIGGPTWQPAYSTDVAVPDDVRLTAVLRAAEKAQTVKPAGAKGNWVTEISWDTDPPDPQGVPTEKQARWLEQSLYVEWAQGVNTVLWYQLADAPPIPNYADSYQAGVFLLGGEAKPSAIAFRFPFVTSRTSSSRIVAWGRSPAGGVLTIQSKTHGGWRTLSKTRVVAAQVFEVPLAVNGSATLRAVVAGQVSLSWPQSR